MPTDEPDAETTRLSRRRVLALTGASTIGGIAGCSGGDSVSTTAPTSEPTTVPTTTATTSPPTTSTPTTTEPTSTASSPTTTEPATITSAREVVPAPSAHHHPLDGFASADWLVEEEPQIIPVTTLQPFAEGSLHEALRTPGPRIIVFEVGGVIDMRSNELQVKPRELTVGNVDLSKVYIAGQTAPPPGITIIRGELAPYARNCIVQHVTVRTGENVDDAYDGISIGSLAGNTIVDHCSVSWSIDENLSADGGADVGGKTLSNNLIAEGLYDSIHPKGTHSKGTLLEENQRDIGVIGNIYASHNQRHPRMKGGVHGVVVNNYVYNFGVAIGLGSEGETPTTATIEGNHFKGGPNTSYQTPLVHGSDSELTPKAYVEDTRIEPDGIPLIASAVRRLNERPYWPSSLDAMPAAAVAESTVRTAGARPAERSAHDARILDSIETNSGRFIDSVREVGGYPDPEPTTRSLDPPAYGPAFAAWLRQHSRAVELGEPAPEDQ